MLVLILCSTFLLSSAQKQCSNAGIGLCVGDLCPTAFTCLDKSLPTEKCCDDNSLVDPTTPEPTTQAPATTQATATSAPCVDLLNPATGVSDCPQRISYCSDSVYYDVMTQQCPKSCGRCSGAGNTVTTGTTSCVDKINPTNGISDCPSMSSYCNNDRYFTLMSDQCPKTCGRCSGSSSSTATDNCIDKLNPRTGTSDCPLRTEYCTNTIYYDLMTDQCAKTCRRCSSPSNSGSPLFSSSGSSSSNSAPASTSSCVDKLNPATGISDCPGMVAYCNDATYYVTMTDQCPRTCGRCSG